VARVVEAPAADGAPITCADLVPVSISFILGAARFSRLDTGAPTQLPSSGRCAGPTAADVARLKLPERRLGGSSYDLSGEVTLGAGPYTVNVVSSLKAISQPAGGSSTSTQTNPEPNKKTVLVETASYDYTIPPSTGRLTVSFAGLPDPDCESLGACDTTGTLEDQLRIGGRTLSIEGSRLVSVGLVPAGHWRP
jgi:hypothetical protein